MQELKTQAGTEPRALARSKWTRPLAAGPSAHLDAIRAIASWAVMWGHLRGLFFVNFDSLRHADLFLKGVYFVTGFGHEAVMVFFVLSGFLISSRVFRDCAEGSWSWSTYAVARATRLYVVLIPGLLLGFFWDTLGSHLFAATGLYTHPVPGLESGIAADNLGLRTFLGNLVFVQTIFCGTFGSNGPLWSLANEFWYYVLFPVLLAVRTGFVSRAWLRTGAMALMAVAICWFLGVEKLLGFLVWLAGSALAFAYARLRMRSRNWVICGSLLSAGALGLCLLAVRSSKINPRVSDLAVGLAFSLFLLWILNLDWIGSSARYGKISHALAGFSYSLYVLHFPLLLCIRAWLVPGARWQPDAGHLGIGLLLGMLTLLFAWLVSLITERRTHIVRNAIGKRWAGWAMKLGMAN